VDQIGSTRLLTDSSGNAASRYDYLPSGEELWAGTGGRTTAMRYPTGPDGFNPKFTGQMRDTENLLDYFHARYYSPQHGRFVSPDPENAGADPTNTQTWNGYSYVANNPLSYTDPSGLGFWSDLVDFFEAWFGALGTTGTSLPTGIPGGGDTLPDNSAPWSEQIPVSSIPGGTLNTGDVFGSGNTGGVIFSEAPVITPSGLPDTVYTIDGLKFIVDAWGAFWATRPLVVKNDIPIHGLHGRGAQVLRAAGDRATHDLGCVGLGGVVSGGSAAASAPIISKPFSAGGTSSTSIASKTLGGFNVGKSIPTPVGMPGTSTFAWRASANLGRIAGRYLPYVGTVAGAAATYACLGSN
jgi:RHS repeat-associated protein